MIMSFLGVAISNDDLSSFGNTLLSADFVCTSVFSMISAMY